MSQLDLFTKQPAKYKFFVIFYVSGLGSVYTHVDIDKNDRRDAIWAAKQKLELEHYQQAAAFLISSPQKLKGSLNLRGAFLLFKLTMKSDNPKLKKQLRVARRALVCFLI